MSVIAAINLVISSRIAPKPPLNGAPFFNLLLLLPQPPPTRNSPPPIAAVAPDCAKFGSPRAAIILAENTTVALANMYAKSLLFWVLFVWVHLILLWDDQIVFILLF